MRSLATRRFAADFPGPLRDLRSGDPQRQVVALRVLGASERVEAIPYAVPFLDSTDSSVRVQAGSSLERIVERIELRRRDMSHPGVVLRERTAHDIDLTPLRRVVRRMLTSSHALGGYGATMAGYIGLSDLEPELRSLLESPQPVEVESATNALKRLGYEVEPAEKRRAWVEIMGKYEKRHAFLLAGGVPGGAERRWFQCESDDQCKLGHDPCGGHWGANVEFIDEVTKWSIEDAWSCLLTPELDYLNANHLSCVLGFCRIGSGSSLELR